MNNEILLSIDNLTVGFADKGIRKKVGSRPESKVNIVLDHVSFDVKKGEILGIAGESGSGKTMTALAVMGLLPSSATILSGKIRFLGENLLAVKEKHRRFFRGGEISMVFQDPMTSFNPLLTVGAQVEEMLKVHSDYTKKDLKALTLKALAEAGLPDPHEIYSRYPHELSGGMRQRAMIAMAMIAGPKLIIADEPTTALDVVTQQKILKLLKNMNEKHGTAIILISHDLRVIRSICGRIIIMKDGKVIEKGPVKKLFECPKTDYTRLLIESAPVQLSDLSIKSVNTYNKIFAMGLNENGILNMELNINGLNCCKNCSKKNDDILTVKNLSVYYSEKGGLFRKNRRKQVIKNVTFSVKQGEILGIAGESGSGKSTLAKAIVGLNKETEGIIEINGAINEDTEKISADSVSVSRPQMVFQDPYGSLNPAKKIGWILEEHLKLQTNLGKKERFARINEIIRNVGLTPEHLERYPHQLSGGQRQRAAIAAALIANPKLVILDEPVSSLDVTMQAQILQLLQKLQQKYNLTYIFISHDLNVIFRICNRVCVIYQGEIVEMNDAKELYLRPEHEYTKELIKAALYEI